MWYKVNFNILAVQLLPTFLRKPKRMALVKCLVKPLMQVYDVWLLYRESNLYKLQHNGQRCFFRKALNDNLDPELRRIYIGELEGSPTSYIYTPTERNPQYLGTKYLLRSVDTLDNAVDFTVFVPEEVYEVDKFKLEYLINFYKPASKRFNIEVI